MIVGVVRETFPGERRVALVPSAVPSLKGMGVLVEPGAGEAAGFADAEYAGKGARLASGREEVFAGAEVICQVRTLGANPVAGRADLRLLRAGQAVIGLAEPLGDAAPARDMAERGVMLFAVELMPRISRAQSMDVLSSQATVAGYRAVLLAASHLPRLFPMLMTAAGTVAAARVLVIGAGVAGLQAIATARRLGAVVQAYDVRPAVKDQVQSLGARFVELELETSGAEGSGGYARAMDEAFYRKQREQLARVIAGCDVVITTAAIPGKKSPLLVTADAVRAMPRGSVIVDLAAERGGNCELTRPDEVADVDGVTVLGPTNLPSTAPYHASQLYARNLCAFLLHLVKDGRIAADPADEIAAGTLLTRDGEVVNAQVRAALGLSPAAAPAVAAAG
jgi:NAD(P) transhydrogenase subunit alpha